MNTTLSWLSVAVLSTVVPLTLGAQQQPAVPTRITETQTCKVVRLQHIDCKQAAEHVRVLFERQDGRRKMTWFEGCNAVLLRATVAEVQQMEQVLSEIDVAPVSRAPKERDPTTLRVYSIRHGRAEALADVIQRVVRGFHGTRSKKNLAVDERTNTLVIRGTAWQHDEIATVISALDVPLERVPDQGS